MDWVVRDHESDEDIKCDAIYAVYDVKRVVLEMRDGQIHGVLLVAPVHRWP